MHVRVAFAACLSLLVVSRLARSAEEIQSPLSPADAQQHFALADDSLRIELAAAEPEVVDPVAIRFDEDGRMWVAEMRDYPLGPPKSPDGSNGEPLSKIRILEDKDGDGRFESATTFAEKLPFVNGLQPWKGGVFVTLAGRVAYMKDTDGDGKMDLDETWFEGFAQENSQLRANHPRLALDNHIYVANGLRGGKVVNRRLADQPVIDISGMDFRFDPLTGKAEGVSGNGQFGLCFDDWGNRFTCTNRNPCRHVVIEDRYLRASPGVSVPAVMHDVAAFAENSRIFPISRAWTTSNLHAGTFTAACGVHIYRGDLLPAEFKGNVFTCDPTGNLVHREIMQPAGPTFTSKPAYEGKEFLASKDEWFRPVNMELGPDGALYVVDMYRCVIEHPDFVPDELKNRPDQRLGDDRGRIWRIVPALGSPTGQRGNPLSGATSADLVKLLEHHNAWQRETAQRLLVERQDKEAAALVTQSAEIRVAPLLRLHALWTAESLKAITPELLGTRFQDTDPKVRRAALLLVEAIALSETKAQTRPFTDLLNRHRRFGLHEDVRSADGQLRAAALRLCAARNEATAWHFAQAAVAEDEDPWMRRMVVLNEANLGAATFGDLLNATVFDERAVRPGDAEMIGEFAAAVASAKDIDSIGHCINECLERYKVANNRLIVLAAMDVLARGLAQRKTTMGQALSEFATTKKLDPAPLVNRLNDLKVAVEMLAADSTRSPNGLEHTIALLSHFEGTAHTLSRIAIGKDERESDVRLAAIHGLSRQPGSEHWQPLLDGFASDTPAARRAILDGLLANAERTKLLLDAIEAGRIKPSELDPLQAKRLLESRDVDIKERAGKLIAAATPEDRVKALADYQSALAMQADSLRGRAIFEKHCAVCHKIGDVGVNVAPDISDSRTKTAAQLLADILQPNRAIDNNYLGYTVRLVDGTVATGILTTETATSITLRQQGGKDLVVARNDIDELRSSGVSLMPEGLERQIPQQEMADLLSFIKNWRYLDGKTPLGGK